MKINSSKSKLNSFTKIGNLQLVKYGLGEDETQINIKMFGHNIQ